MRGEPGPSPSGALSRIVRTSVATLYSDLVTRPTGRAVRFAIERQLEEAPGLCLSILDFSQVRIVDFSCADEVIAKLLLHHRGMDGRTRAFFVACGLSDHHRDPIEAVLSRHGLLLVTMDVEGARDLWGPAPERLRRAWLDLEALGRTAPEQYAVTRGLSGSTARSWLNRLVTRRIAVANGASIYSLCALVTGGGREGDA